MSDETKKRVIDYALGASARRARELVADCEMTQRDMNRVQAEKRERMERLPLDKLAQRILSELKPHEFARA